MADSFQPRFVDLVRNYTATIGTGNFVLGSAVAGYRSFDLAIKPGESFYYSAMGIEKPDEVEVGRGTMQVDGSISRVPIGEPLTAFTFGNKSLALIAAAEWFEGVQEGAAGNVSTAASRQALAALSDTSKPAMLHEQGRDGLFMFDPSDLSSKVAGDTAQGIYVAPATDPSGASGAWTRRYSGPLEARWFGAAGDGVTDDKPAIQGAIDHAGSTGGGTVRLGPGTFAVASDILLVFADDVTIDAREATIVSTLTWPAATVYLGGSRGRILGGNWKITTNGVALYHLDVEGTDCEVDGASFVKEPEAGGYQAYVRPSADGFRMIRCRTSGSNGVQVEGSNGLYAFNTFRAKAVGGDDGLAIKAIGTVTENIRIIGNLFENHATFVGIGSEIGTQGANDPAYSSRVRGVHILGNQGINVAYMLFIKPGAITSDYRDGIVESVTFSDNTTYDLDGSHMGIPVWIQAGKGAIVRDIKGKNNRAVGRTVDGGNGNPRNGMYIYLPDYTGVGTAPTSISDIDVQLSVIDPYNGAAFGTAGVPGSPFNYGVSIERANPAYGVFSDITLDVTINGTLLSGIFVGPNLDDVVTVRRAKLTNVKTTGSTAYAGIQLKSRIEVSEDIRIAMANASDPPYRLQAGTSADVVCPALTEGIYYAASIGAGSADTQVPWIAKRNSQLIEVKFHTTNTVVQSDTNYMTLWLRHVGVGIFTTAQTKATGSSGGSNPLFSLASGVPATIFRYRDLTVAADQAGANFPKDSALQIDKLVAGAGAAITNGRMVVRAAPY